MHTPETFQMSERAGGTGRIVLYVRRRGAVVLKSGCMRTYTLESLWIMATMKNGLGRVF